MKRILTIIICLSLIGAAIYKFDFFVDKIVSFMTDEKTIILEEGNIYQKNKDYKFVQITNKFVPYSYQDILNIFYTTLDHGYKSVTFHCPNEYVNCVQDINHISKKENDYLLTTIGNYVSPYNNFVSLTVEPSKKTIGDIILKINYKYTDEEIDTINKKVDKLFDELITDSMTLDEKINTFHDYIINTSKYDVNYEKELKDLSEGKINKTTYPSDKATGPLLYGYAICSGYTDAMAIVLNKLNVENIKVASENHIWNAIKEKNIWKHIDLTWDDPVSTSGAETILQKFNKIDTKTLEDYDIKDHKFDHSIYQELI